MSKKINKKINEFVENTPLADDIYQYVDVNGNIVTVDPEGDYDPTIWSRIKLPDNFKKVDKAFTTEEGEKLGNVIKEIHDRKLKEKNDNK